MNVLISDIDNDVGIVITVIHVILWHKIFK